MAIYLAIQINFVPIHREAKELLLSKIYYQPAVAVNFWLLPWISQLFLP